MTRSKLRLLALCFVVLGMMAIAASSAQAKDWLVLNASGTSVTLIEEIAPGLLNLKAESAVEKESEKLTLLTKLVGLKVSVSCTNLTSSGIFLKGEGKLSETGKIAFTGCTVLAGESKACTVKSPGQATGTVETEALTGELVLHELSGGFFHWLWKEIKAGASAVIAKLRFEGECSLPEVNNVTGTLFLKDCEGFATTHKVKHLLEQGPLTSLSVGADTAEHLETSIDGSIWVKLIGAHAGLAWSGM